MFGIQALLDTVVLTTGATVSEILENYHGQKGGTEGDQKNAAGELDNDALIELAEKMCGVKGTKRVEVKDRKWRLRNYPQCFVGSEAVEWMIEHKSAKTVRDAVQLGNRLMRQKVFARVTGKGDFDGGSSFFRFLEPYLIPDTPTEADVKRLGLTRQDLISVLYDVLLDKGFSMKERKGYGECFPGAQLVHWMMEQHVVKSTQDAVLVGNLMLQEKLLQHVKDKPVFKNANVFYKIRDKKAVLELGKLQAPFPGGGRGAAAEAEQEWEFVQSFGDDNSAYECDDADDLVTAVEFNETGEYLAIGDKAGRVSIVQEAFQAQPSSPLEYKFFTEFQSHDPEFDCLKSIEIEPKINCVKWLKRFSQRMHLLTSNDKTVKLWRLSDKDTRRQRPRYPSVLPGVDDPPKPEPDPAEDPNKDAPGMKATCKRIFGNAHGYNIHSLSLNSDGESFFSADDLRINLWHLERNNECFTMVDLKPPDLVEIDELITSASFHPVHCNLFMHGSSKGLIRLSDMRQRALVDREAQIFEVKTPAVQKTYFSEITNSILDAKFSADGKYILARDYMTLRLWDTSNTARPLTVLNIHPFLSGHFQTLLDNECIFDQFQCALSPDGTRFVTGSYSNCFYLHNSLSQTSLSINARAAEQKQPGEMKYTEERFKKTPEFRTKMLKVAWHPRLNAVAVAGLYKLYLYQTKTAGGRPSSGQGAASGSPSATATP